MTTSNRRQLVLFGLSLSALAVAGCGGGSDEPPTAQAPAPSGAAPAPAPAPSPGAPPPVSAPPPAALAWRPQDSITLVAGAATSVDLALTLPDGVARGGRFSISAAGARLPDGITLSEAGVLRVAANAAAGLTSGVVFQYQQA